MLEKGRGSEGNIDLLLHPFAGWFSSVPDWILNPQPWRIGMTPHQLSYPARARTFILLLKFKVTKQPLKLLTVFDIQQQQHTLRPIREQL